MRTTLQIDNDVLESAKGIAAADGRTIGAVISDLARRSLQPTPIRRGAAHRWFEGAQRTAWATAPFTESGFVRVSSNRAAIPAATSPALALEVLVTFDAHLTRLLGARPAELVSILR